MKKYVLSEISFIYDDCFYNAERSTPIKIFDTYQKALEEKNKRTIEVLREFDPSDIERYRCDGCQMIYSEQLKTLLDVEKESNSKINITYYLEKMANNEEEFFTIVEVDCD